MMERWQQMIENMNTPEAEQQLMTLYGAGDALLREQKERYTALLRKHHEAFGTKETILLVSAPGRTEIGGNHTDHNHGRVLAASVNLDILSAVSPREDDVIRFHSEGRPPIEMRLNALEPVPEEEGTSRAIIRGVAAGMREHGYQIGGFDAVVTSTVAPGSGMSSSAALEVMLSGIWDALYNQFDMPFVLRAQIGQMAENKFFGKPSGLLDQMASAAGGMVTVDFQDPAHPQVEALPFDFAEKGYALVVVGTGGSHADLTADYAAIPKEMKEIASLFGQETLRGISLGQVMEHAGYLRKRTSDRALLRAIHFIRENDRVPLQVAALKENRMEDFMRLIIDSGRSSFMYLQNVYARPEKDQSLSLALCMAEALLSGKGAWRIHGGGFAGTTLNFVPLSDVPSFVSAMENAFGSGCCHVLNIRPVGAARVIL